MLTPALAVSIAIAIFALVTQFLTATGAISLSTTQQLTMWLVAGGLVVLLWIAYMAVQAQARLGTALEATAAAAGRGAEEARKAADEREKQAEEREKQATRAERAAKEKTATPEEGDTAASTKSQAAEPESQDAWVPPDKFRRLNGPTRSVTTADVFPNRCYLHSIVEEQDHAEETDTSGSEDANRPRRRMYRCAVVDPNPVLKDRQYDAIVTVLTDKELSSRPGVQHSLVEFDGLTITPYVTDRGSICMGYSLRATGVRFVAGEG